MTTRFQKGKSGNPKGKPPGAKDKRTELRALLQPHAAELIQKAVNMALEGDTAAMKMCLDRLLPTVKPTTEAVKTELPTGGTLAEQGAAIYKSLVDGTLSPDEATSLMSVLAGQVKIIEIDDIVGRIEALEREITT